ncbi:hypothetical protein MMC22_002210 [Lobaria immixta]|nr:hypothetical protein [Lobaria immixta]
MSGTIGNHGKVAEGCDSAHIPEIDRERANPWNYFPFLKLPGEIRNEVYRLVLLTKNVSKYVSDASHTERTPYEVAHMMSSAQLDELAVGTVRCESWRRYTLGYQVSMLRANRQVYHEAWTVFQRENLWAVVRVNKAGFGESMKELGFPVGTAVDLWSSIRFPVMKVTVEFPNLEIHEQGEVMVIASVHLNELTRALWTAKGATEMKVTVHVQPPLTKSSPSPKCLLSPFLKLRNIKQIVISGVSDREYENELERTITTTDGINQAFFELAKGLKCLQRYIKEQRWERAVLKAEKHSTLMADSMLVYDERFLGIEPGLALSVAVVRCQASTEITIGTALAIAEVTLHLQQYDNTISFLEKALFFMGNEFIFQPLAQVPPTVTVPNCHQLPQTGMLHSEEEINCTIFLIRARAYMGMQQAEPAYRDIEKAREFMTNSVAVASVSRSWHAMFGQFPDSAPLSPATALADVANNVNV